MMIVYIFRLEVYVSTESDVVAAHAKVETVSLGFVVLGERVGDAANVCNKANLLADSVRDTGLDSNLPCVNAVLIATNMTVHVRETAIGKEREVTSLCESVTNIRVQDECVSIVVVARNVETHHVATVLTVSVTNLYCYVKFVIEFVTNFRKKIEVVGLANLNFVDSSSLMAVTNFTTYPNLCVS
mgnify:CR=1 FL=1